MTRRFSGAAPPGGERLDGRVKPVHGEKGNWFKGGLSVLFCLAPFPAFAACADDEATLFSCLAQDQARTIELCAVRDDAAGGYQSLQYHYGTPDKVELTFPADRRDGRDAMAFAHAFDKNSYVWSLRFGNGGYTYRVFGMGDDAGVEVWKNKKMLTQVMCGERPTAYTDDIRRAASCDLKNPFGKEGCGVSPPTRK